MRKSILIFCEGKSEHNYIQELNKLLRENTNELRFSTHILGGISNINSWVSKGPKISKQIKGLIKEFKEYDDEVYIWVDYDIYHPNVTKIDQKSVEKCKQEIKSKISLDKNSRVTISVLLNYMKYEDLFMLHQDDEIIEEYHKFCKKSGYYKNPQGKKSHFGEFLNNCPAKIKIKISHLKNYKKGDTPELDKEKLQKCIRNIEDDKNSLRSDIKEILELVIKEI